MPGEVAAAAKRRIILSLVFGALAGGGVSFLVASNVPVASPISNTLLYMYTAWTFFWGVPAVWGGLRRSLDRIGCVFFTNFAVLAVIMVFVLSLAMTYSIFGGGLFHFLRALRTATK
jgi:hypothetical protein